MAANISLQTANIYKNGSTTDVSTFTGQLPNTLPTQLTIEPTFQGNIREIRYWTQQRTLASIIEYLNSYIVDFTLVLGCTGSWSQPVANDATKIENRAISGESVTVAATVWADITDPDFLCASNQYKDGSDCKACLGICQLCSGADLYDCSKTLPQFLDLGQAKIALQFPLDAEVPFPITLELWFKATSWNIGVETDFLWIEPLARLFADKTSQDLVFLDRTNTEKFRTTVPVALWKHLALVFTQTTGTIYLDGKLMFSGQWSFVAVRSFHIGLLSGNPVSRNFNGKVKEIRLWKQARTQASIKELQNIRIAPNFFFELSHYLPLSEGKGTELTDTQAGKTYTFSSLPSSVWSTENCKLGLENCLLLCDFGTYKDTQNCNPCGENCAVCDAARSATCAVCANAAPFKESRSSFCYASCPTGQHNDGTPYTCTTKCPANAFLNSSGVCVPCDSSCATCFGDLQTTCSTCVSGKFLFIAQNGEQTCETSCTGSFFYKSGSVCVACHETCTGCTGPEDTKCSLCAASHPYRQQTSQKCLATCPLTEFFSGSGSNRQCVTKCSINQFTDSDARSCVNCDSTCATCDGAGPQKCKTCHYPNVLDVTECKSKCSTKKYPQAGVCADCDATCLECVGPSRTNCTKCTDYLW